MRGLISLTLLLSIGVAASVQLSRRQNDEPANDETYCRETSFTDPRWYLYSSRYVETSVQGGLKIGTVGFNAMNVQTGISFDCLAKNVSLAATGSNTSWYNCDNPMAQFKFDINGDLISMRETWTCGNNTASFSGHGSTPLPLAQGCGTDNGFEFCVFADTGVSAELTSPIQIVPMSPSYEDPPYEFPLSCTDRSTYPTWEVANLLYEVDTSKYSSLSLNLTNLSTGKNVSCVAKVNETSLRKNFHRENWVHCEVKDHSNMTGPSGTEILFDRSYNLFGIRQKWKCPLSKEQATPDSYDGFGTWVVPELHCSNITLSAAGTASCTIPTTNFTGFATYNEPSILPHTAYLHSCTMNSMNATSMTLGSYSIEQTGASFAINNPGPSDEYDISGLVLQADGNWHPCEPKTGDLPWQLLSCEYSLDQPAKRVGFRLVWACDDRDPYRPVVFNATVSGPLSSGSPLTVSNLSWVSTNHRMDRGPSLPWI